MMVNIDNTNSANSTMMSVRSVVCKAVLAFANWTVFPLRVASFKFRVV
jgi:hypothetical protein